MPFVISFSDDDSGSDSEECGQGNAYETKNVAGVNGRHPAASFAKLQMLPGNAKKGTMVPRNVSLSHTFVSSMTKDNVASSNNGNPVLGEKRSHVKHINILNKNKAEQEHGCNENVHLNSSKLQDLRQLIAIRENELKLKAAKQNKEPASGKTDSATNLSNRATRIRREAPADFVHLELKEPDKKRLKVGESHSCKVNSDGRKGIAAVESNLCLEKSVLELCGKPIVDNHSCCDKEIALGTTQWQNEEENRGSVLASNLHSVVEGTFFCLFYVNFFSMP